MNGASLVGELVLVTGGGQGVGAATSRVPAARTNASPYRATEGALLGLSYALHAELLPTQESSWP
jgi:hypothetical protein